MKIKVCGMKDLQNIQELLSLPIDMMGFILYPKSKRYVDVATLSPWIAENLDQFGDVKRVGVFVNAELDQVLNGVHDLQLDYVQLHGTERPEYCETLLSFWASSSVKSAQLIKAFAVDDGFDFNQTHGFVGKCAYFLFDTKGKDYGGNGVSFDWEILKGYDGPTPFLLSGGIDLGMETAIQRLDYPQLIGVDINSRFEIEPGIKDVDRVKSFVNRLKVNSAL